MSAYGHSVCGNWSLLLVILKLYPHIMKRFTEAEYMKLMAYEAEIGNMYGPVSLLQFNKFIETFYSNNQCLQFDELVSICELLTRGSQKNTT